MADKTGQEMGVDYRAWSYEGIDVVFAIFPWPPKNIVGDVNQNGVQLLWHGPSK